MKLYQYDHCPFCIRADMVANYKQIAHEKVYLLNDDEETCFRLINAKMVPIFEDESGKAMAESLDIAHRFDEMGASDKPIRPSQSTATYHAILGEVNLSVNCLLFPRNIQIGLPEFTTQSAKDYFRRKKEETIGRSFETAMSETDEHISIVEEALAKLPSLPLPSRHNETISWDDVVLYPQLRNLTMVKGLTFPAQVMKYLDEVTRLTGSHTYFDKAI